MTKSVDIKKAKIEDWVSRSSEGKLLCDVQGSFKGDITGDVTGNAGTVTNGVYLAGNQTIGGVKTFSSTIAGNITGNAGTVNNGFYTTTNQTISGVQNFTSHPQVAGKYINTRSGLYYNGSNYTVNSSTVTSPSKFGTVIGGYTPHSATSKIMAFYHMGLEIAQTGTDDDANINIVVYAVQSNGALIGSIGGAGTDQKFRYLNSTRGGTWYGQFTAFGAMTRASDGKCYVNTQITWSDATTGYVISTTNRYHSVTFLEMY
jgi:hypothetical protein